MILRPERVASGCALVGFPRYYARFGFVVAPEHLPPGLPADYFMLLRFGAEGPASPIQFHPAFATAA